MRIISDKIYSRKEVLNFLNISTTTLKRYMDSGKIKYCKTGKEYSCRVTFLGKDIIEFLEKCRKF